MLFCVQGTEMPTLEPQLDEEVEVVRAFNRLYSQRMGILGQQIYDSPFSMTEMRVIYEVYQARSTTARDIALGLGLDGGYLSRILQRFEAQHIVVKKPSKTDARKRKISLTPKGWEIYLSWAEKANGRIRSLLGGLKREQKARLLSALQSVQEVLSQGNEAERTFKLRPHTAGDMGLIIHTHAVQFAKDYGWNSEFEALVADKTSEFIRHFDPRFERCWVADSSGELIGSVFIVKASEEVGELRLLFVDPRFRGLGIGDELLKEAIRFARHAGYQKLQMWTESISSHAAKLFQGAGFKIVEETPHFRFGKELVGQYWEMPLG